MEKTVCQVVSVVRVELKKSCEGGALSVPGMTELPSCPVCLERLVSGVYWGSRFSKLSVTTE